MRRVDQRVQRSKPRRIRSDAPDAILFVVVLIVDQATMQRIVDCARRHDDEQDQNHPFCRSPAVHFVKTRSLKSGDGSFECDTCIEPLIHVQAEAKRVVHRHALHLKDSSIHQRTRLQCIEERILEKKRHHGEKSGDRQAKQIKGTAHFECLLVFEREQRADAIDQPDRTHQHGEHKTRPNNRRLMPIRCLRSTVIAENAIQRQTEPWTEPTHAELTSTTIETLRTNTHRRLRTCHAVLKTLSIVLTFGLTPAIHLHLMVELHAVRLSLSTFEHLTQAQVVIIVETGQQGECRWAGLTEEMGVFDAQTWMGGKNGPIEQLTDVWTAIGSTHCLPDGFIERHESLLHGSEVILMTIQFDEGEVEWL